MTDIHFDMCYHIHVAIVEPSALGFRHTLMGQVVISLPVHTVDSHRRMFFLSLINDAVYQYVVINMHRVAFLDAYP